MEGKQFVVMSGKKVVYIREEIFKKNFPQYVTEKGVCLSPFWDLFDAGFEAATFELNKGIIQVLTKEKEELTQAKELLKKIEKIVYNGENEIKRLSKIVDILAEAEQFLKESAE